MTIMPKDITIGANFHGPSIPIDDIIKTTDIARESKTGKALFLPIFNPPVFGSI